MVNNATGGNGQNGSKKLEDEKHLRHHVEQRHLEVYRQNSYRTTRLVKNDLESKINRFYSKILVDYHWLFLIVGVLISFILTGVSFVKQPLPNFLDPRRGFGARGEGTLTSQLIVMKNVNAEITKYNKYILDLYESVKKNNKSDQFSEFGDQFDDDDKNSKSHSNNIDDDFGLDFNRNDENEEEAGENAPPDRDNEDDGDENEENEAGDDDGGGDDKEPPSEDYKERGENRELDYFEQISESSTKKSFVIERDKRGLVYNAKRVKRDDAVVSNEFVEMDPKKLVEIDIQNGNSIYSYNELMRKKVWRQYTAKDILEMMPVNATISKDSTFFKYHILNRIDHCQNYSLSSDKNLEFYFTSATISLESDKSDEENLSNFEARLAKYSRTIPSQPSSPSDSYFIDIDEYSSLNDPNYRLNLDIASKLKYIKEKEDNLLNIRKLKSLCKWDLKFINIIFNKEHSSPICYFSLPQAIMILNNKTDCDDLNANDVRYFLKVVRQCYSLHESGVLFAAAEEYKQKSEINELLSKNNPISAFVKLPSVRDNICFKKNLIYIIFDYLIDKDFMASKSAEKNEKKSDKFSNDHVMPTSNHDESFNNTSLNVKISTLLIMNGPKEVHQDAKSSSSKSSDSKNPNDQKLFNQNYVYDLYLKHFHETRYNDKETKIAGINLLGIREEAAMRFISQEMLLVALAITLIVIVTLLYLKSVFISMIVNLGVAMSVGVSFFAYRIVFDIDLFPFINMMAAFLLIGIACDDVYVLFDSWYNEKGKIILEDLPDMIEKQYKNHNQHDDLNELEESKTNVRDENDNEIDEYILPPIFIKRRFVNNGKNKNGKKISAEDEKKAASNSNNAPGETESFLNLNDLNNTTNTNVTTTNNTPTTKSQPSNSTTTNDKSVLVNTSIKSELIEKGIDINDYELNPAYVRVAPLTDEQMVRVMGGTLRHAASSIFVTSFTTAAAFLTNYITKLPYVQLFGVFTGTCILVYFTMVITMVAAFVISYEKFIQPFRCKVQTNFTKILEAKFQKSMDYFALFNYRLIAQNLPKFLIKFRLVFFIIFLLLGVAGMLAVFYKPQLKPPANWRTQFFKTGNLFENFEFNIKDHFWSYVNEEKRNLTNPEIFFVFGIIDKDNGRIFNPDDDGHLIYDKKFDFMAESSQIWLNEFINNSIATRRDLFLVDDIVQEWKTYLYNMQQFCYETMGIDINLIHSKLYLPYKREDLAKCRDDINTLLINSTVRNFEELMGSFPRRIIFMAEGKDVNAILLRVNANRTFYNHDTVRDYYLELTEFHKKIFDNAPEGFRSGWFISVAFALYDLQYQLITGTYSSLVASMAIALIILLLTSGNILISLFAIITISFSIADTIAIFVFMGWELSILESVIIIMSVGLSVDFSCHYGVAYINCDRNFSLMYSEYDQQAMSDMSSDGKKMIEIGAMDDILTKTSKLKSNKDKCSFFRSFIQSYKRNNKERFMRINDIFERVGSAVLMAAFTTFLAGLSMSPTGLTSFSKMGQFLMLVMCFSYIYATFFFVPMCALFGPTKNFGNLRIKEWVVYIWDKASNKTRRNESQNDTSNSGKKKCIYNNNINSKLSVTNANNSTSNTNNNNNEIQV